MTRLQWDKRGERNFAAGLDRGVLYLADNTGVVWNGLTGLDEDASEDKTEPLFFDGVKYLDDQYIGDYAAKLTAFTCPEEFLSYQGVKHLADGLYADDQPVLATFGLSYRTKKGNDVDEIGTTYQIHIVYNITAVPSSRTHATRSDSLGLDDLSWDISGVPQSLRDYVGYKPTAHVIIESSDLGWELLADLENILYGTDDNPPTLMPLDELVAWIGAWAPDLIITDWGDGTWTADGSEEYITDHLDGSFTISPAPAVYTDPDTYELEVT